VLGAFKATPIRELETEVYVSPLDLWLSRRIARLQARLERTGLARRTKRCLFSYPNAAPDLEKKPAGYQWVGKWTGWPIEQ